jgi:uncharacterized protein (DUF2141 family)
MRVLRLTLVVAAAAGLAAQSLSSTAADVVARVTVTGPKATAGRVGCSLFSAAKGFPMDASGARAVWHPAGGGQVECRFAAVADGTYAIAVSHDLNDNNVVDTNFLGIPTEGWGVSNNARPKLRAPRFDEAAFKVSDGRNVQLDIRVE